MNEYTFADFLQTKNATARSFSPDGSLLAYLSNLTGTHQVYVTSTAGGETRQVTDFDEPVTIAAFSPISGDELVFGKDSGGNERTQLYLLNIASGAIQPLTDMPDFKFMYGGRTRDGKYLAYSSNQRNNKDFDIYIREMDSGQTTSVFENGGYCASLGFSPSGRYLVVGQYQSNVDNDLFLIDLENQGQPLHLTPHAEETIYDQVRWLPDETKFFLVSNEGTDKCGLRLYDLDARSMTELKSLDWDIETLSLSWDAAVLAVSINEEGYDHVLFFEVASSGELRAVPGHSLPPGLLSGLVWSQDGKKLAFTFGSATSNMNAWVWDRATNQSHPITRIPTGVPAETMVEPQLIHYASFDGRQIPAFLYLPTGRSVKPYPAVVHIHGGPESQARPGFSSVIQYLLYRGIAVIEPNVRGSSGYGKAYLALDDREKRLDSVQDLAWLHRWIRLDGRIDSRRVALMGGSYGGYMTLAGLAFQPYLWAAGVDIVGMSNLETFLENTADYRRALREKEYGSLATDREYLRKFSPIHKVDDIRAPLFIVHGANDPRVPLDEALQIHESLKARQVRVELLVYGDEGHGLSKLTNRLDAYPKVANFLQEILRVI